jgi:NACalpha-BTF3-like transcription factor
MENSIQEFEKKEDNCDTNQDENIQTNEKSESNIILSENEIEKKRQEDLLKQYYINLQKQKYERFIEIIMNQTTYTKEEAVHSLEKHKGDITLVIKEFLGVVDKTEQQKNEEKSKSLHQKRYSVIREYMDNAATNYMKRQEISKKMNELHEKQKKAQEAQEAQEAKEESNEESKK